jgi:uncharacterized metal-binding protein YceD (DUF177 family)
MLGISIKSLSDGKYPVNISTDAAQVADMFPEFTGSVVVTGDLQKLGRRYIFTGTASCDAHLLCDMSGEEFTERINAPLALNYVANTNLFLEQMDDPDPEPPYYIREDDVTIDITEVIRQELAVNLPLKRVAPAYRDKEFATLHPQYDAEASNSDDSKEIDPRWAALKNINFSS